MRIYICISLLFTASAVSTAQLLIGPVAGVGTSWISFHDKESRDFFKQVPVLSYQGGVDISFQVRKNFYLHTALLYSRKGKSITADAAPDLKHKEFYHHLDAPILFTHEFKFKVGQNKVFKLYMGMGPNVSYWLTGKGSLTSAQLLEDQILINWRYCYEKIKTYDLVGALLKKGNTDIVHYWKSFSEKKDDFFRYTDHFSGNFYWFDSQYFSRIRELTSKEKEYRYNAEKKCARNGAMQASNDA